MNRKQLQSLAKTRLKDAKALLGRKRWSAAYYLAGYVVECGLKSCILRHLDVTGLLFRDRAYLKKLADCWTHDFASLINLAGLDVELGRAIGSDTVFKVHWDVVVKWRETSRYEDHDEGEVRRLIEAIEDREHGVLQWIQSHW